MPPIARYSLVAFDCPDAFALATFYADITGGRVAGEPGDEWVKVLDAGPTIAFQQVPDHRPPEWPGPEKPQQAHVDFEVVDFQPGDDFRVFLDPAGHPFCLVLNEGMS
jgi:catechol 2,3-dioxygenase-like lactoylglutathione lyase family enzyme